ncbi:MAG: radical SAM protein, partial [Flavobacteriales bacterium]|nr:radical SAM protein [Flavobacteriales bacterium]
MHLKTLFITPPFTQLNTPYPATTYLTGYLRSIGYSCEQSDLSIELFNAIFTSQIIEEIFFIAQEQGSIEYKEVWNQRDKYIHKVDMVIAYLRQQEEQTAKFLITDGFLPNAHRSKDRVLEYENLSTIDKAKHLGTLFIEELGDFITANIDEFFSFTRYAEQLARTASSFDTLESYLNYEPTLIEEVMLEILEEKIREHEPKLIAFTVPFPGNLFSALRCAQLIKYEYPHIKVAMGGGYCNTELRRLNDPRIFEYVDFISLDDGEIPLQRII